MSLKAKNLDIITGKQQRHRSACEPAWSDQVLCYTFYLVSEAKQAELSLT